MLLPLLCFTPVVTKLEVHTSLARFPLHLRSCLLIANPHPRHLSPSSVKHASSGSSKRWLARQGRDRYVANAKVQDLKSRAAFKLLEINERYRLFRKGQTVVDLVFETSHPLTYLSRSPIQGYAPGSWSQVRNIYYSCTEPES